MRVRCHWKSNDAQFNYRLLQTDNNFSAHKLIWKYYYSESNYYYCHYYAYYESYTSQLLYYKPPYHTVETLTTITPELRPHSVIRPVISACLSINLLIPILRPLLYYGQNSPKSDRNIGLLLHLVFGKFLLNWNLDLKNPETLFLEIRGLTSDTYFVYKMAESHIYCCYQYTQVWRYIIVIM